MEKRNKNKTKHRYEYFQQTFSFMESLVNNIIPCFVSNEVNFGQKKKKKKKEKKKKAKAKNHHISLNVS